MNNTPSLGIIFAAGGSSRRFEGGSKLFIEFEGKPVFVHSLLQLSRPEHPSVLVVPAGSEDDFRPYLISHGLDHVRIITGGQSRSESVFNGLQSLCSLETPPEFVAVHDAARPLADYQLMMRCLEAALDADGAIAAHRVTDTIHRTAEDGTLAATPPRESLWAAETPQLFRRNPLCRAFAELPWRTTPPTDEAALVASLPGARVKMVENRTANFKITFRSDLALLNSAATDCK